MPPNLATLEDIKKDIRCLLISRNSQNITLDKLNKMYKDVVDQDIPYKDFYFTSLEKFLRSMPDVLGLKLNNANELCAYHIDTEKSQHISSLVAREKPENNSDFKSKFKVYHVNPIDPRILSEVLQELKTSLHQKKKNGIRKTDVLSAIEKRIGKHAFFTIKDLNSQLNECTHILTHDDDYIRFKDRLVSYNITNLRNIKIENFDSKLKDIRNQKTKIIDLISVGSLIKETTKIRLRKLIETYVEGIWCSELPQIYQREYGMSLEYSDLGFNSIVDFTSALPDIFQVVESLNSKRLMLVDSNKFKSFSENQEVLTSVNKCFKEVPNASVIFTQTLNKYYKALIPNDVMAFNDTVDQIKVNSLLIDPIKSSYHVVISEVHNPSFFWVTLCRNKKKITHLMNKLQKFYTRENHNYKIPCEILKPGLHVTCIFADVWHRGIIKKLKSDGLVVVHFYDYGTSSSFDPDQLYFLNKQFSVLPAQAIPCCLNNVKPLETAIWSKKINKIFTKEVFEKYFVAYIISTDNKNNSMVVDLVVANNGLNGRCISQWMIANKLAEYGTFLCEINNITFTHYQECWNRNHKLKCYMDK